MLNYEFSMNCDLQGARDSYRKAKEKENEKPTSDMLRMLGYNEDDIAKSL